MAKGNVVLRTQSVMARDNFGRFISEIEAGSDRLLRDTLDKIKNEAQRRAPSRTGRLKRSIKVVMFSNREGIVIATAPYAMAQEKGARPHPITGPLSFEWRKGEFHWRNYAFGPYGSGKPYENWGAAEGATVHHPGNRAQPFLEPSFKFVMAETRQTMSRSYRL